MTVLDAAHLSYSRAYEAEADLGLGTEGGDMAGQKVVAWKWFLTAPPSQGLTACQLSSVAVEPLDLW
jgi:hypothetical protein